ncbi:MAG: methionine biosynthesis protein MetW, partial [Desulfobulbia bacterium]
MTPSCCPAKGCTPWWRRFSLGFPGRGLQRGELMRFDLQIIASWIEPGSRVLDLGCGEGELLQYLKERKGVKATGIEKDEAEVAVC